ncbi:MAG TPA: DUF2889 domain-containing protein [Acidimicrobiia bacterium]|nr:DUF2889 domain-containing protein [Acidimicrobiia bacterium]
MRWPEDLSGDRFPGTVRREISVEATIVDGRFVFDAVLRDRWFDDRGNTEEIHGYELRIEAVPPALEVVALSARPRFLPFPECPLAAPVAQRLVGLELTRGFRADAKAVLGGIEGCTHLLSLVLAVADHQVVANYMRARVDDGSHPPGSLDFESVSDVCAGWREGGTALRTSRANQPHPRPHVDYGDREP